jgi:hypothetical protein
MITLKLISIVIYKNKRLKVNYNSDMGKIVTLNGVESENILNDIFENDIIVYEDIQGSKIWVNWNGKEFTIKPKSLNNEQINMIDLAMQNYYNPAINYFNTFDIRIKGLMPKNWSFCFEYFPDLTPANIEYQKLPKNGLVLTEINKSGKYGSNTDELQEYARLFNVDFLPIIFEGRLSDVMKEAIKYFLNTSEKDLEYVFGEQSFAFFFYKILNPNSDSSFLMNDKFQDNLEKIVIRVKNKDISFEILNPLYTRISSENSTEFTDVYTLILLNFLTFCQSINLDDIKLKGERRDLLYIYLMCKLFNIYVADVKEDLEAFEFVVPEFFDKEKFKINRELINNKLTREIIEESSKLEYIFKVILGSFNKKRKKPIGVFTDNTVILFNNFVDKINTLLDNHLKKMREVQITQAGLLDFGDFFEINFDTDANNEVYPDVYDEIQKGSSDKKDKKGIKKDIGK